MTPLHSFAPRTARILWAALVAVLALTLLAEPFVDRHGLFGPDAVFGFNAWYGFAACVGLVAASRLIGLLLKRPDTYYDR